MSSSGAFRQAEQEIARYQSEELVPLEEVSHARYLR